MDCCPGRSSSVSCGSSFGSSSSGSIGCGIGMLSSTSWIGICSGTMTRDSFCCTGATSAFSSYGAFSTRSIHCCLISRQLTSSTSPVLAVTSFLASSDIISMTRPFPWTRTLYVISPCGAISSARISSDGNISSLHSSVIFLWSLGHSLAISFVTCARSGASASPSSHRSTSETFFSSSTSSLIVWISAFV